MIEASGQPRRNTADMIEADASALTNTPGTSCLAEATARRLRQTSTL